MDENKKTNPAQDAQLNFDQGINFENQRHDDRRHEPSEGFAYISTVGWIDRRERLRRKDDPFDF